MKKFKFLQGIRGAACIAVVYTHCCNILAPANNSFHHIGEQGVLCFYTLSAFLLSWRLLQDWDSLQIWIRNHHNKLSTNHHYKLSTASRWKLCWIELVKYLARRFFRVYPSYIVLVCCIASSSWLQSVYEWKYNMVIVLCYFNNQ